MNRRLEIHAAKMRLRNARERLAEIDRRRRRGDPALTWPEFWRQIQADINLLSEASMKNTKRAPDENLQRDLREILGEALGDDDGGDSINRGNQPSDGRPDNRKPGHPSDTYPN